MKLNGEKLYLLSSAVLTVVLATSSASANKQTHVADASKHFNNTTYTASGKMDKKTAVMLVNLLRNPHLQVRAEINGQALQTISPRAAVKNPMHLLINYTITGKTDRKTVLRLKKLLQNNQRLQINAEASFNKNTQRVANFTKNPKNNRFVAGFTPFYSNVTPPTYVQGNTVWMPVLINQPPATATITTAEMIAGN